MKEEFSYKTLIISELNTVVNTFSVQAKEHEVQIFNVHSIMDGLEYLMDFHADSIIIDTAIGKDAYIQFLTHISDDYENEVTPIILLSFDNDDSILNILNDFNIISIVCNTNWTLQTLNLLKYLKIQKANTHCIQDSLLESEGRGTMDKLTGAYNRYGCEDIFYTLTSRVKAYSEPFSIIMIDIDHFKAVNDTYGHDIGDEVLKGFSKIIMESIRRNDSLVRLGGEEFVVFMSNVNLNIAIRNAEKIRVQIEDLFHSSKNLKITASFGVVEYEENEEMENMIKRSDELLYIAKDAGRNRVISSKV